MYGVKWQNILSAVDKISTKLKTTFYLMHFADFVQGVFSVPVKFSNK